MKKCIVGIDEVGRGSLAGPVVVAAVVAPANSKWLIANGPCELRDSKRLTPKKREQWFKYIKGRPEVSFALARVYPRRIEKLNISKAANLAAFRAYDRLIANGNAQRARNRVFLDGGLYLGNGSKRLLGRTVTNGDEKIKAVMIASIIAKVHRDRLMTRLGKIYPKYGFEIHKGYGTRAHLKSLKKHGLSKVHRLTFLRFTQNSKR
ncbi:MAG: ribonuclease HII [Candidatus Liptonbacteria bacterium]|nr:ribonuclease HII [Candidatus Liptonbacteria bacterium]